MRVQRNARPLHSVGWITESDKSQMYRHLSTVAAVGASHTARHSLAPTSGIRLSPLSPSRKESPALPW